MHLRRQLALELKHTIAFLHALFRSKVIFCRVDRGFTKQMQTLYLVTASYLLPTRRAMATVGTEPPVASCVALGSTASARQSLRLLNGIRSRLWGVLE